VNVFVVEFKGLCYLNTHNVLVSIEIFELEPLCSQKDIHDALVEVVYSFIQSFDQSLLVQYSQCQQLQSAANLQSGRLYSPQV